MTNFLFWKKYTFQKPNAFSDSLNVIENFDDRESLFLDFSNIPAIKLVKIVVSKNRYKLFHIKPLNVFAEDYYSYFESVIHIINNTVEVRIRPKIHLTLLICLFVITSMPWIVKSILDLSLISILLAIMLLLVGFKLVRARAQFENVLLGSFGITDSDLT